MWRQAMWKEFLAAPKKNNTSYIKIPLPEEASTSRFLKFYCIWYFYLPFRSQIFFPSEKVLKTWDYSSESLFYGCKIIFISTLKWPTQSQADQIRLKFFFWLRKGATKYGNYEFRAVLNLVFFSNRFWVLSDTKFGFFLLGVINSFFREYFFLQHLLR